MGSSRTLTLLGRLSVLVAALIAVLVAMYWPRGSGIGEPLSFETMPQRRGPLEQLPAIVARSEPGGILVSLQNDTEDRQVFVDPMLDHLLIEYSNAVGGAVVRFVGVPGHTLGPGDATAPTFVSLEDRAGPVRVEFVCTQYSGNTKLVARTDVTVP